MTEIAIWQFPKNQAFSLCIFGKPGTDGTFPGSCDYGTFCSWLDSHASSLWTPRTM
jgi:hypothetical protein